eukprot:295265-Amphidinium_carterae.1
MSFVCPCQLSTCDAALVLKSNSQHTPHLFANTTPSHVEARNQYTQKKLPTFLGQEHDLCKADLDICEGGIGLKLVHRCSAAALDINTECPRAEDVKGSSQCMMKNFRNKGTTLLMFCCYHQSCPARKEAVQQQFFRKLAGLPDARCHVERKGFEPCCCGPYLR